MRLNGPTPHDAPDPLHEEWTAELRSAVVADLDAELIASTAQQAALSSAAAAASLATAAGLGGTAIGGTMTTTSATMNAATTASATFGTKMAALVVAGATVTGGLAATGTLPDAAQQAAADLGARVGIDLPRPDLTGIIEMVDVGTAGTVSISVDGDAISVADLAALSGFSAVVEQQSESNVVVRFDGEEATYTLVAGLDAAGNLVTEVTDTVSRTTDELSTPSGRIGVEGSAGAGVVTDPLELESDLDIGVGLDLDN